MRSGATPAVAGLRTRPDDDEVDFAKRRIAVIEARPVDTVEYGVAVRELGGEAAQRRDLVRSRAGGFQHFPAVREGAGHVAVPISVGVGGD